MNKGTITIILEDISVQQTERFRRVIHTLFTEGAFNIRNGQVLLHFGDGELKGIDINMIKWRQSKPSDMPLVDFLKGAKIEILHTNTQTSTRSGVAINS